VSSTALDPPRPFPPARPEPSAGKRSRLAAGWAVLGFAALALWPACRSSRLSLGPSVTLESVEGYASLRLTGPKGSGKSDLSFFIQPPDTARVDVFDPLGRTLVTLISLGGEAYFVAVPQRAYWRGNRDELLGKLLGFDLTPGELAGLLSGRWDSASARSGEAWSGWTLTRDARGRVVRAQRRDAVLEVVDFFSGGATPHTLIFRGPSVSGRLKVIDLRFNVGPQAGAFRLGFLEGFAARSWEEMERLLADEPEVVR
jgi:hypothetical protein